jgi:hypothetical protein
VLYFRSNGLRMASISCLGLWISQR